MSTKEGWVFYKLETGQWKKCYITLTNQSQILLYDKNENTGTKVLQTEIDLKVSGLQILPTSAFPTYRKNLFEIEVNESQKHLFSANSEAEKEEWLFLLNKISNKVQQNDIITNSTSSESVSTPQQQQSTSPSTSSANGWESKRKSIRFTKTSVNLGLTRTMSSSGSGNDSIKKQFNAANSFTAPLSSNNSTNSSSSSFSSRSNSDDIASSTSSFSLGHLTLPVPPPVPDESQLVVEENEVKQGTLEKLTECLHNSYASVQYITDFLLSYRAFAQPKQVLDILYDTYSRLKDTSDTLTNQYKKVSRLRICNFLKKWVELNFQDFENDEEFIKKYTALVDNFISVQDPKLGPSLKQKLHSRMNQLDNRNSLINVFNSLPPAPILPKSNQLSIITISPIEIARQLTLLEYHIYKSIQPNEFFNSAWASADKDKLSPNILKLSNEFNNIGKWVAYEIVREKNLKLRTKKFKRFVKVADECLKLNNFHAVFEITGGLQNSAVHRLKKTQENLPPEIRQKYEELLELIKPGKSWKNYREELHTINPPCIPFIGIYQTDLEIQQYQHKPYNLQKVEAVQNCITECIINSKTVTEQELFDLSMGSEPRVPT